MTAASDNITLSPNVATQVTQSDCTKIRVQLLSPQAVRFMATPNATAPTHFRGSVMLSGVDDLIPGSLTLADLFPHVTSPVRLFAIADQPATLSFSHD